MNLVEATLDGDVLRFGQFRVPLDPVRRPRERDGRVILGIRPEAFEADSFASDNLPRVSVTVSVLEQLGSDVHASFELDAPRVAAEELRDATEGDETTLFREQKALFTARLDARTQARVGGPLELAVDPGRFYFFSPQTWESLLDAEANAPA